MKAFMSWLLFFFRKTSLQAKGVDQCLRLPQASSEELDRKAKYLFLSFQETTGCY